MAAERGPRIPTPIRGPDLNIVLVPPEFIFPDWWNASRELLAEVAESASQRQISVTAEGSIIPVTVGRDKVGGYITDVLVYQNKLVIMAVWGVGPNEAVENVYFGDQEWTGIVRHYLGGNAEATDATLSAARAKYTANPTDICFSVIEVTATDTLESLNLSAIIKGRNDIFDPRLPSWGAIQTDHAGDGKILWGDVLNVTTGDFSVEFRLKWLGTSGTSTNPIFKKQLGVGDVAFPGWSVWADSAQSLNFSISDGTNEVDELSGHTLSIGDDIHVAMTVDRTGDLVRFFIDGLQISGSPFDSSAVTGSLTNTSNLQSGRPATTTDGFVIDEIRFWNDIRTPAEILANLNNEVDETDSSLKGYWRLNEKSGTTAFDSKGSNDGTISGAASFVDALDVLPDGADAYTSNPSLVQGWFVDDILGETTNKFDLARAADFNSEALATLSGNPIADRGIYRRRIGLTARRAIKKGRWLTVFQEYAQVFLARDGASVRMIPNEDGATVDTVIVKDVIEGTFTKKVNGLARVPNQVTVVYTDINDTDWKDLPVSTPTPGGGVPIREQRVSMPGIQSLAQATRYGIERLNKYTLSRLSGGFDMRDDGLKFIGAEIIALTDVEGASAKKVRLNAPRFRDKGRFALTWNEHDPLMFSNTVVAEPSISDTGLPSPNNVPNVVLSTVSLPDLNPKVNEPQFQTGIYLSTINVRWDALANYPFDHSFELVLKQAGTVVGSVLTTELSGNIGPLEEGLTYDIEVKAIGVFGVKSATAASASIIVDGKNFPPTDVLNFIAFGVGGEIRMRWDNAVDNIAIWRYEIRYGSSGVSWAAATFLTRTDSLQHTSTDVAAGTYDVLIKAIDNAFNESANAAVVTGVEVDQSRDIFLLQSVNAAHASNVSMFLLNDGSYVVDSGETWNALFPTAMNGFTNALYSYQTPGAAEFVSAELDPAAGDVSGQWLAVPVTTIISGSPTSELELFIASVWTAQGVNSVVKEAAKARYKMSGSGDVFIVFPPIPLSINVFAVTEDGSEMSIGGGECSTANAGTQLEDTTATLQTDLVKVGDVVKNLSDGSKGTVSSIASETVLVHSALAGGANNDWEVGDNYAIGSKITLAAEFTKIKEIVLTPNNTSNPVSFEPDDIIVGNPTSFLVFGFDTFNEEVAEPFLWTFEGI